MKTSPNYKPLDYEFGILIQSYRHKARLTQLQLAKLVGVSKRAVLNWEAGNSYPQHDHLRRLVEIFLDRGCFTEHEEQGEAQILWEKASASKKDVKDAFNPAWFNTILPENPGLLRSVPARLFQNLPRQDWSEAAEVRLLFGREHECDELENWIIKDKQRVISIFGIGGIGKTTLALNLAHHIASSFDYVIFRTLQNAPSLDELLDSILKFLLDGQLIELPTLQREKLALLMDYFRRYRCLLILDNLETIMQNGLAAGEFREGYTDYAELIRRISELAYQSCLIITSREKPQQLAPREERNGTVRSMALRGLDNKSCQAILNGMGINCGEEFGATLAEHYGGNPLALKLIAEPIREMFGGDIEAFLASSGYRYGGVRYILDQHFGRLSQVEQDILYWLALSRDPLDLETIQKQSVLHLGQQTFSDGLRALLKRFLIEQIEGKTGFSLQGVVIEYATERLINHLFTEITAKTPDLLCRYPLLQTQTREYIRLTQIRLILDPLLAQLRTTFKKDETVTQHFKQILESLCKLPQINQAYAGGNLLNLLIRLEVDLTGWNFENLALWQAYLVGVELHAVNMRRADLSGAIFTEANVSACCLAYSPDGKQLAIGCVNGAVKVWQMGKNFDKQLIELRGHTNLVCTVTFSSDGALLASGSADGTVRLWELNSGNCLVTLKGTATTIRSIAFSPDDKWLASARDDQTIHLWQVSNAHLISTIPGDQGWVMSVAFSPDGKRLASGGFDSTIKLWDVSDPPSGVKLVATLRGHEQWVSTVAFSPDGRLLASGSADFGVRLWSVPQQSLLNTLTGHSGIVMSVTFSPDGELLLSSGVDRIINLYTLANPLIQRRLLSGNGIVMALSFNPDGETFVSSSTETSNVKLWSIKNLGTLDVLRGYTNFIYSIAVSPNGNWLGAGGIDYNLVLWDLTKPFQTARLVLKGHTSFIVAITFDPAGQTIATCSSDSTIKLWHLTTKKCWRTLVGHTKSVMAAVFSPDSRLLISGDEDGNLKLWSMITGQELTGQVVHEARLRKLVFSPDGYTLATIADDGFIKLWDVDSENITIKQLAGWPNQSELVMSLAFNHDGSLLYSGGSDGLIRCWKVATGECISRVEAHKGMCWSLEHSPKDRRLASAGEDGFIHLWNIERPEQPELLTSFAHGTWVRTAVFLPDGEHLFSAGEGGKVKLWNLADSTQATTLTAPSPYEGLNITGITGITEAQRLNLLSLGAIETPA